EAELFRATRDELKQPDPSIPNPYRGISAEEIHRKLRAALLGKFPWLGVPAPPRIPPAERATDLLRLAAFVFIVLFCLSLPGLVLAPVMSFPKFAILFGGAALLVFACLWRIRAPRRGEAAPTRSGGLTINSLSRQHDLMSPANPLGLLFWIAIFLVAYVVVASVAIFVASLIISALTALITGSGIQEHWKPIIRAVLLGLFSLVFTLPAIVLWLRVLER